MCGKLFSDLSYNFTHVQYRTDSAALGHDYVTGPFVHWHVCAEDIRFESLAWPNASLGTTETLKLLSITLLAGLTAKYIPKWHLLQHKAIPIRHPNPRQN
jgi:hypothetical protein